MHTNHSKTEEPKVTMCVMDGLFIVGKLVGGNKLIDPRIFSLIEGGNKMQLSPLPCLPTVIHIARMSLSYPIPVHDVNMLNLYRKVTTPQQAEGNIIDLPGRDVRLN